MELSFLGLCHRLYNFIKRCLATQAMKSVTLGGHSSSSHQASAQLASPFEDAGWQDKVEPDPAHEHEKVEEMGDSCISSAPCKDERDEEEAAISATATQAQPPKKTVSINETIEELVASKKKSKKKKGMEKMGSFDNQEIDIDEPKPLKSILKVGSKQDDHSYTNPGNIIVGSS